MSMEDFTAEEVTFLRDVVKHIGDYRVRARAADLLWVLGERHERARYAAIAIEDYKMWPVHTSQWSVDGRAAWSRAVDLSKRLGRASHNQVAIIETTLRDRLLQVDEGIQLLQLGEILLTHRLGIASAAAIAQKYETVAVALPGQENLKRRYLRFAQNWYLRARDAQNAALMVQKQVDSWIREAESRRAADNRSNLVAASFYEVLGHLLLGSASIGSRGQ